jgi:hypothetical protein
MDDPSFEARKKKSDPVVAKGTSFPFQISVACWIDLLGYGKMISKAGFNPLDPTSTAARLRVREFHYVVAKLSGRTFPTLVLNDGAVAYRDLSLRSASVTQDFLQRCWTLYCAVKDSEIRAGYPGPRMVIAAGFRMKGRRSGIDKSARRFEEIRTKLAAGAITAIQALFEAQNIREYADVLPQLQANFAFTKAYLAENSGTRGGFSGANCFVDLCLIDEVSPMSLKFGEPFSWKHETLNLGGCFARLIAIEQPKSPNSSSNGIRNGLQVAQFLAGDQDVLKALRRVSHQSM